MKRLLSVCILFGAGPALAGGPVEPPPEPPVAVAVAPAPEFSWTGFYAGLSLTNGGVDNGVDEFNTSGFGVQAGYLWDLGTFVAGGELAYVDADIETINSNVASTRVKAIGGFDAGRFLPYAFVGLSSIEVSDGGVSVSDTTTNYGLGARYAFGGNGQFVAGLEYLVEDVSNFDGSGQDLDIDEIALRFDIRF